MGGGHTDLWLIMFYQKWHVLYNSIANLILQYQVSNGLHGGYKESYILIKECKRIQLKYIWHGLGSETSYNQYG